MEKEYLDDPEKHRKKMLSRIVEYSIRKYD